MKFNKALGLGALVGVVAGAFIYNKYKPCITGTEDANLSNNNCPDEVEPKYDRFSDYSEDDNLDDASDIDDSDFDSAEEEFYPYVDNFPSGSDEFEDELSMESSQIQQ